jgi:hypothetical protein
MTPTHQSILSLSDAGRTPAAIAAALPDVPLSTVYAVLRRHRPARKRAPRPRTSDLPRRIEGLASRGYKVARIAELLGCSRAYVYRYLP